MPDSTDRLIAGRYRLLDALGRGGMGIVWRARDEYLHRDVAVKEILLPEGLEAATRADLLERFVREARAAARLDHPAIISVYDVVTEHGLPWIVMRLVRGRSVDQLVRERGPLPPDRVAQIGLRVLDALDTAHAEGILHRDVTPRNVLVGDDDRVVLTDFGIASMDGATALTRTGAMIGSPGYIAPERLRGRAAGPESDLWSLGAVLYFAAEGTPAYKADELPVLIGMVLTKDPEPPVRAGALAPVLAGLLSRDPATRSSTGEARRLLRSAAEPGGAPGDLPTMGPETWQHAGGATPPAAVPGPGPTSPAYGPPAYGPFPGGPQHPQHPQPSQPSQPQRPMGAGPNGAGAAMRPPRARPGGPGAGRGLRRVALTAGLTLLLGAAVVVANVMWNPLHLIGEGEFATAPVCGGMTPAVVDATIPKPRHEDRAHCEWFSLDNPNHDLKVLSTTRYTRSGWHSADERAHAAMNEIRAGDGSEGSDVDGPNIGDESAISVDDGEATDGSGSTVVWFRVSNVVVKMMLTHPNGAASASFDVTSAARAMARSLGRQR